MELLTITQWHTSILLADMHIDSGYLVVVDSDRNWKETITRDLKCTTVLCDKASMYKISRKSNIFHDGQFLYRGNTTRFICYRISKPPVMPVLFMCVGTFACHVMTSPVSLSLAMLKLTHDYTCKFRKTLGLGEANLVVRSWLNSLQLYSSTVAIT